MQRAKLVLKTDEKNRLFMDVLICDCCLSSCLSNSMQMQMTSFSHYATRWCIMVYVTPAGCRLPKNQSGVAAGCGLI